MARNKGLFCNVDGISWLITDCRQAFVFDREKNKSTDVKDGQRVDVVALNRPGVMLSVHLPEQNELLFPPDVDIPEETKVEFDELLVRPYVSGGQLKYSATAKSVKVAGGSAPAGRGRPSGD